MSSIRRVPLLALLVVALVVTGFATTFHRTHNPSQLPSGLSVSVNAESTALYCTGLSSGPAPGHISFYNTASQPRRLSVSVVSSQGRLWSGTLEVAAHSTQSLVPGNLDKPPLRPKAKVPFVVTYGVGVQISGGGVIAEEIAAHGDAEVPCASAGTSRWYATGFDTTVGSSGELSVYNPTGTPAVMNISAYTAGGFSAPEAFQGLSVPAHAQIEVNLGEEIVNTSDIGVSVKVLRGALEIVGVQDSDGTLSYDQGIYAKAKTAWFPNVTTEQSATAQIRVANPSSRPATVIVNVGLGTYKVPQQSATINPYSTGTITITPNSAIPAAGYANLTLHSNVAIVTGLATGTGKWVALTSPQLPSSAYLVRNFSQLGFDAATVTNTSAHSVPLTITSYDPSASDVGTLSGVKLAPGATENLSTIISAFMKEPNDTYVISTTKPVLVVSLTVPSRPRGLYVVSTLNGR
ncbi:MAG TPA: DUF5719 family protein [Acidimicrobiales bacterium]|jgi:hypothetical protein|nr:DUF5719 family protein [Acidimicrobiales bacterium]